MSVCQHLIKHIKSCIKNTRVNQSGLLILSGCGSNIDQLINHTFTLSAVASFSPFLTSFLPALAAAAELLFINTHCDWSADAKSSCFTWTRLYPDSENLLC